MSLALRSDQIERMDTDCIDEADYRQCLCDLAKVNTVTLAHRPTLAWLDVAKRRHGPNSMISVYDVAFGQGDMLRAIARWATRRGQTIKLSGIDMNPEAAPAARSASPGVQLDLTIGDVFCTKPEPAPDYIVSSLFTHHLSDVQVVAFLQWMEQHARLGWFINDLHRHSLPYYGFTILSRVMGWHRFVQHDGPISIARAFKPAEWAVLLARAGVPGEIRWVFPFRLCVSRLR